MSDATATVAQLMEEGLTRNEAIAYMTLLADDSGQGLTGYEVAARSNIPRSVVYATLSRLEANGAAFSAGEKPARYVPIQPSAFVEARRVSSGARLDALAVALSEIPKRERPQPIWIVSGYTEVIERADHLIRSATASVYMSVWPRELARLEPALQATRAASLHRVLHCPVALAEADRPQGFSCWVDGRGMDPTRAGWSHKLIVVVDRREALIGGAEPAADNQAVRTSNPSIVDVATNHMILDITLLSQRAGRPCVGDVAPMMRPHLLPA
jgi:HTH-type transcriptional regulator, sugar sensing transcriptional regulator